MPKISSYPDNGVKNSDQYVVANSGVNRKRLGILPHLYQISPSISGDDLVLTLLDIEGNGFGVNNPLQYKIHDEIVVIESALSVTKADGTNWADLGSELATLEVDLFAYLINETGASAGVKLGWSRYPHGTVVGDFSSTGTDEDYLAGPTNYNATDTVQIIGRFNAILSGGAGYTWSLPATSVIINTPIRESRWLTWTPTITGYSSDPTGGVFIYKIFDDTVFCAFSESGDGTSNDTTKTYSLPFPSDSGLGFLYFAIPVVKNNGVIESPGVVRISGSGTVVQFFRSALAAWTNSGACRMYGLEWFYRVK